MIATATKMRIRNIEFFLTIYNKFVTGYLLYDINIQTICLYC